MATSSSAISNENPRVLKFDLEGNLLCYHGMSSVRRVAGSRSQRQGQEFYGCPLWPKFDCDFFYWKQHIDTVLGRGNNSRLAEIRNEHLQLMIANLEVEKMLIEEENKGLKLKMARSNWGMKKYAIFVILVAVFWFFK